MFRQIDSHRATKSAGSGVQEEKREEIRQCLFLRPSPFYIMNYDV